VLGHNYKSSNAGITITMEAPSNKKDKTVYIEIWRNNIEGRWW